MIKVTIQEAIEIVRKWKMECKEFLKSEEDELSEELGTEIEEQAKVCEIAITALEKQIPKQPRMEYWSPAICPTCRGELSKHLGYGYYEHLTLLTVCECGQKLDWNKNGDD